MIDLNSKNCYVFQSRLSKYSMFLNTHVDAACRTLPEVHRLLVYWRFYSRLVIGLEPYPEPGSETVNTGSESYTKLWLAGSKFTPTVVRTFTPTAIYSRACMQKERRGGGYERRSLMCVYVTADFLVIIHSEAI